MAMELQAFVDSPFSFRVKQTSNGMMVTNMKIAAEGMDEEGVGDRLRDVQAGRQRSGASVEADEDTEQSHPLRESA